MFSIIYAALYFKFVALKHFGFLWPLIRLNVHVVFYFHLRYILSDEKGIMYIFI